MMEPLQVGQEFGNYKILEKLGAGGMGIVYKALDKNLEQMRALKVLNPFYVDDNSFNKRFRVEAKNLAKLDHPNIVRIFALDIHEALGPFIVMEYVDGKTLKDWIEKSGRIEYPQAIKIFKQVLSAIQYAHDQGIIHRDIKPSNIMLDRDRKVKITDFGLAKNLLDPTKTMTLGTAGTLYYMSPEQVLGMGEEDWRSDIYALGITFYEILAGRTPFEKTDTYSKIRKQIVKEELAPPDQFSPDIPTGLVKIIMKSLEKEANQRFQSAGEMLQTVEKVERELSQSKKTPPPKRLPEQKAKPPRQLNKSMLIGLGAALALVLILIVYLTRRGESSGQSRTSLSPDTFTVAAGPVTLQAFPYGAVEISDGTRGEIDKNRSFVWNSIAGKQYVVRFRHPAHGNKEIKVIVANGAADKALYCYFESYVNIFAFNEAGNSIAVEIVVDNGKTGKKTPARSFALGPGEHEVTVYQSGYEVIPEKETINVQHRVTTRPLPAMEKKFQLKRLR
jgi:serine/threonine protein kinase